MPHRERNILLDYEDTDLPRFLVPFILGECPRKSHAKGSKRTSTMTVVGLLLTFGRPGKHFDALSKSFAEYALGSAGE